MERSVRDDDDERIGTKGVLTLAAVEKSHEGAMLEHGSLFEETAKKKDRTPGHRWLDLC
jgi:hypothetical protein